MNAKKFLSRFLISALTLSILFLPRPVASADMPATSAVRHLENVRRGLQLALEDSFVGQTTPLEQAAAMAVVSRCINSEAMTYWLQDMPQQIGKQAILHTAHLAYSLATSDSSVAVIGTLERLALHQARQAAAEWMREQSIQTANGRLRGIYEDHRREIQRPEIQYTLAARPVEGQTYKVTAEFRSVASVSPPSVTSRTIWDAHRWQQSGREKLPPFVIKVSGQARSAHGLFGWVTKPEILVDFPANVIDLNIPERSGFLSGLLSGAIDWGRQKINDLTAWLSPSSRTSSDPELIELRQAVDQLRETVENGQIQTAPPPTMELPIGQDLADLIEGLASAASSIAGMSEESRAISQEMAKIARYSAEIMKWQAENQSVQTSPEEKPITQQPNQSTEETEEAPLEKTTPEGQKICSVASLSKPSHYPVIINELAWMGRTDSANHEWIELKNLSDETVSLAGWQLFNRNQNLMIIFESDQVILPQGFSLLVRTDDSNVPEATADHVYTGALKNREEAVYLFDHNCQLQDFAQANPDWPAGDNASKRTMERTRQLEWQSSRDPHGTPKRSNSTGYQEEVASEEKIDESPIQQNPATDDRPPVANAGPDQIVEYHQSIRLDASLSGDDVGIVVYRWDTNNDGLYNHTSAESVLDLPPGHFPPGQHTVNLQVADAAGNTDQDSLTITVLDIPRIIVSEVQFHGETNRDEFIELYNPHPQDIELTGWSLRKKTSGGQESPLVSAASFQGNIPAHGYFLIVTAQTREDGTSAYRGESEPDLFYSGRTYYFAPHNTVLLYAPDGSLMDKVGFGEAQDYQGEPFPENPPPGFSLGRRWLEDAEIYADTGNNAEDFEWQIPTPGRRNQSPQPETEEPSEEVLQDGSAELPFLINACQDLLLLEEHLGAFYRLTNDIDCSETESWNGGTGFRPIGQTDNVPFVGELDGQGFAISGLHRNAPGEAGGLFLRLSYPAHIKDLRIENAFLRAEGYAVGLLAGIASGQDQEKPVIIERVFVEGKIIAYHDKNNAPQYVGGLVGQTSRSLISESGANVLIQATNEGHPASSVGGLIGSVGAAIVRHSFSQGQILGEENLGGFAGRGESTFDIRQSYSQTEVIGQKTLGGFIAVSGSSNGHLANNYATGKVIGCSESGELIGGFVGQADRSRIEFSYSTGKVQGRFSQGFIGGKRRSYDADPVYDSYYDINTSGRTGHNMGAIGLTTAQMGQASSFPDWDFEQIWQINEGYPQLRQNP